MTPNERADHRKTPRYVERSSTLKSRCLGLCEVCHERAAYAMHHLDPDSYGSEDFGSFIGLAAVCDDCHFTAIGHSQHRRAS